MSSFIGNLFHFFELHCISVGKDMSLVLVTGQYITINGLFSSGAAALNGLSSYSLLYA